MRLFSLLLGTCNFGWTIRHRGYRPTYYIGWRQDDRIHDHTDLFFLLSATAILLDGFDFEELAYEQHLIPTSKRNLPTFYIRLLTLLTCCF